MAKQELINTDSNAYSADTVKELTKRIKAINTALTGIDKNFEKIAFNLYWVYQNQAYKTMGCDSITDFASQHFGFSKTTTYDFINIVDRFGVRNESDELTLEGFMPAYAKYSPSKLSVISSLSDVEIQSLNITPEMSVRDIKKAVKVFENSLEEKPSLPSGTADTPAPDPQQELQIDNDNTVLPPPALPDPDEPEDDFNVYCSFYEEDLLTSDKEINVDSVAEVFGNILRNHPGAQIMISYRDPVKRKGGKKK